MMKKAIAVLLSILMICGIVPLGMIQGFAAQTEETETTGDLYDETEPYCTGIKVLKLPDNTNYIDEEDLREVYLYGLTVETTWSDGETDEYFFDEYYDGPGGYSRGVHIDHREDFESNKVYLNCGDASCSFDITPIPNPVESIEIAGGSIEPIRENTNGHLEYDYIEGEEVFIYDDPYLYGIELKINYTDGTSEITEMNEKMFKGYPIEVYTNQYITPWTVGEDNILTVSYLGKTADLKVTIVEDLFDYIEVIHHTENVLVENIGGSFNERYNSETYEYEDYYYYDYIDLSDVIVRIHYKDGSYEDASIDDCVDGNYLYDDRYQCQHDDEPFELGSDNKIKITYRNAHAYTYITVIENPVKSLEVLDGFRLSLIENLDGDTYNRYNPDTGEYEDYFNYDTSGIENAKILITYNDGSTKIAHPNEKFDYSQSVIVEDNQEENHWEKGKENYLTVSYLDVKAQIPVDIIDHPVKSIEIDESVDIKLIENLDGYWERPWAEHDFEEYFIYEIPNINDVVIKINYNDGTSKTAEAGSKVDGREITLSSNQSEKHFTLGSDNYMTVEYAGKTTELPVTVIENPIESITINSAPTRVYYLHDIVHRWHDDITGLNFTVNFKDGTKKTYTTLTLKSITVSTAITIMLNLQMKKKSDLMTLSLIIWERPLFIRLR